MVALPKPKTPHNGPKSYGLISLLGICYKLMERFIYKRILSVSDPHLLMEQAGFRAGCSTLNQVVDIDEGFTNREMTGLVLADL